VLLLTEMMFRNAIVGRYASVKRDLQSGINVDFRDRKGNTLLLIAGWCMCMCVCMYVCVCVCVCVCVDIVYVSQFCTD